MAAWLGHLVWLLGFAKLTLASPLAWLHMALQAYLCTGLFITGHDAMHGTVSGSRRVNDAVGTSACFLFAGLSYRRLVVNHRAHHTDPTGPDDPDFSTQSQAFLPWFTMLIWPSVEVSPPGRPCPQVWGPVPAGQATHHGGRHATLRPRGPLP